MKIKLFFFITLFLNIFCKSDIDLFNEANKLYIDHKFNEAVIIYETINYKNFSVLFNLGNSFYQANDFINSLVFFKKAEKQVTSFDQINSINHNINLVLKKLNIQDQRNFFYYLYQLNSVFSLVYLQILFVLLTIFLIFVFFRLIFLNKIIFIFLITLDLLILSSIYLNYNFHFINHAIIIKHDISLFAGPGEDYHVLKNLNAFAQEIKVLEKKGDWFKIQYNDIIGWVQLNSLSLI